MNTDELKLERFTIEGLIREHIESHGSCDVPTSRIYYREYYRSDPWFEVMFRIGDQNVALFMHDPAHSVVMPEDYLYIRNEEPNARPGSHAVSRNLYLALQRVFTED